MFASSSGSILAIINTLGGIANSPDVKGALASLNLSPYISLGIAIFGAITLMSMDHHDHD